MKKVLLSLLVVSSVFISCDKNDDNVAPSSPVHGKWEVKSYKASGSYNGQPVPEEELEFSGIVGTIFEFKAGNQFSVSTYDDSTNTWEIENGTYVYYPNQNKIDYTMHDGNEPFTETMNIKLLSANELNFNITSENTDGNNVAILSLDVNCKKKN